MLLSRNLLSKINENYVQVSNNDLTNALNAIGVEVEQIIISKVNPDLKVGRLMSFRPHPNSDFLNLCDVVVENKKYQIVCGAKNLKQDQWVVVALPGTKINDKLTIQTRVIREVTSEGMLCGLEEILPHLEPYLSDDDKKTIIQIPTSVTIDFNTFFDDFGFNDTIFDLSIPANRPELNGLYFLAHELNLQFNFTTQLPFGLKFTTLINKKNTEQLTISSKNIQSYFLAKMRLNLNEENLWKLKMLYLQNEIKLSTNYLDFGHLISILFAQPALCFRAKKINSGLVVKELEQDIDFTNSKDQKLILKKGAIVTTDKNGNLISVTGMYLSKYYQPKNNGEEFYIELANFKSDYIINFKKDNSINDNITNYFSKTPSNNVANIALNWATKNNWFLNENNKPTIIYATKLEKAKSIFIKSYKSLLTLLGTNLSIPNIIFIFRRIGIQFYFYKVKVPSYRNDLNNIPDLVEELLKSIDINKLQTQVINFKINSFTQNQKLNSLNQIRNFLINKQFYEVKTYNLTSLENLSKFNWFKIKDHIKIQNPISSDRGFLRKNLINEMLEVLAYNQQHKQPLSNIFEIQKIQLTNNRTADILCCLITSNSFSNALDKSVLNANDYTNKAIYEALEDMLKIKLNKSFNTNEFDGIYDVNNFTLHDQNNELVGVVGKLKNNVLKQDYKLKTNVYCICLNLNLLLASPKIENKYSKVGELNPIYKDLTFSNPNKVDLKEITNKLLSIPMLTSVNLSDVYTNNENKHYTISLKIQPNEENLTSDQISSLFQNAISLLREQGLVVKEEI